HGSSQRLREILDEIVRVLEPDGHAEQVLGRSRLGPFDGMTMLDERLRSSETRGARNDLQPVSERNRRISAAAHLERQHRAGARHLTARDFVSGMRRKTWIVHLLDALVPREKIGDASSVQGLRAHAPWERADTAQREPALERRRDRAAPLLDGAR